MEGTERENLHGVSGIKERLCTLHRDQRMFFNAQVTQMVQITTIPCEVSVSIAETGHQCPPSAVKDAYSCILFYRLDIWHFTHSSKALSCF